MVTVHNAFNFSYFWYFARPPPTLVPHRSVCLIIYHSEPVSRLFSAFRLYFQLKFDIWRCRTVTGQVWISLLSINLWFKYCIALDVLSIFLDVLFSAVDDCWKYGFVLDSFRSSLNLFTLYFLSTTCIWIAKMNFPDFSPLWMRIHVSKCIG
jgi:hypothetical protein